MTRPVDPLLPIIDEGSHRSTDAAQIESRPDDPADPFRRELLELLAAVDRAIAARSPRCDASGRCCRFTEYGHTLFLSSAEAELLFEPGLPSGADLDEHGCPYQLNGLCTARERRPIGCRVYFCDPAYEDGMGPLSESFIAALKALHDRFGRVWDYRPLHRFKA